MMADEENYTRDAPDGEPLTWQQCIAKLKSEDARLKELATEAIVDWMCGEPSLILDADEEAALKAGIAAMPVNIMQLGETARAYVCRRMIRACIKKVVEPEMNRLLLHVVTMFQTAAPPPWPTPDLCKEFVIAMAETGFLGLEKDSEKRKPNALQWNAIAILQKAIASERDHYQRTMPENARFTNWLRERRITGIPIQDPSERQAGLERAEEELNKLASLLKLAPPSRGRPKDFVADAAALLGSAAEAIWAETGRPIGSKENKIATRNTVASAMRVWGAEKTRNAIKGAINRRTKDVGKSDQNSG